MSTGYRLSHLYRTVHMIHTTYGASKSTTTMVLCSRGRRSCRREKGSICSGLLSQASEGAKVRKSGLCNPSDSLHSMVWTCSSCLGSGYRIAIYCIPQIAEVPGTWVLYIHWKMLLSGWSGVVFVSLSGFVCTHGWRRCPVPTAESLLGSWFHYIHIWISFYGFYPPPGSGRPWRVASHIRHVIIHDKLDFLHKVQWDSSVVPRICMIKKRKT